MTIFVKAPVFYTEKPPNDDQDGRPKFQLEVPHKIKVTSVFPKAKELLQPTIGLSYFINAKYDPLRLPSSMTALVQRMIEVGRYAGFLTDTVCSDVLPGTEWLRPLCAADRDILRDSGLNYVGFVYSGMAPIVWDHQVISSGDNWILGDFLNVVAFLRLVASAIRWYELNTFAPDCVWRGMLQNTIAHELQSHVASGRLPISCRSGGQDDSVMFELYDGFNRPMGALRVRRSSHRHKTCFQLVGRELVEVLELMNVMYQPQFVRDLLAGVQVIYRGEVLHDFHV